MNEKLQLKVEALYTKSCNYKTRKWQKNEIWQMIVDVQV